MREVESGHGIMRDLRVEANHLGVIERVDERQHVPDRREKDVSARLVRLGLEREPQVVALRLHVLAQEIDGVAKPLDRLLWVLRGIRLDTLSSAPEYVGRRAQLDAEVYRVHGFLKGVLANVGVVARERAVAEDWIAEEVRRRHRHLHAGRR